MSFSLKNSIPFFKNTTLFGGKHHAVFKKHRSVSLKTPHCFDPNTAVFGLGECGDWSWGVWYLVLGSVVSDLGQCGVFS
jgi:hypothetical protein